MVDHYFEMHSPIPCPTCSRSCPGMRGYNAHKKTAHLEEWKKYESLLKGIYEQDVRDQYANRASSCNHEAPQSRGGDAGEGPRGEYGKHHPLTHYDILGISIHASQREIKKAARRKRIACHPDKYQGKEGFSLEQLCAIDETAKQVGWAADVLCDERKRAVYDAQLRNAS